MNKLIAVSTTRDWNMGDEVIWRGIQTLLEPYFLRFGIEPSFVYWNRNPDLMVDPLRPPSQLRPFLRGNYLSGEIPEGLHLDGVVFAGSPEWTGPTNAGIYRYLRNHPNVPILALGLGEDPMPPVLCAEEKDALKGAIISARSAETAASLSTQLSRRVPALPCPSVFAAAPQLVPATGTCYIIQRERGHQGCNLLAEAYTQLRDKPLISYYLAEYEELLQKQLDVRYVSELPDLVRLMSCFGGLVTTRLHAAVLASQLGLNVALLGHSPRVRQAAALLPRAGVHLVSTIADAENYVRSFSPLRRKEKLRTLLEFRQQVRMAYSPLLNEFCGQLLDKI